MNDDILQLTDNPDDIIVFTSFDDLIMAAYNYVKETGNNIDKYVSFDKIEYNGVEAPRIIGFKSADGKFFVGEIKIISVNANKSSLYQALLCSDISLENFINRQLLPYI